MKKAILVVSFGTTHRDTREVTIDVIERKIQESFPEYEVRRAFTAHKVIHILKTRDRVVERTPEEALEQLREEGFQEVIVQPLHIIAGQEYEYLSEVVTCFKEKAVFSRLLLGRPLLFYKGEEGFPDDYMEVARALEPYLIGKEAVLFIGHGTMHPMGASYSCMENTFEDMGLTQAYLATVEGYPSLERAMKRLKRHKVKEVTLMPFMLVAGDHAKNDMAGDEEDSFKRVLIKEGLKVQVYLHGLGEIEEIQKIYLKHLQEIIEGKYEKLGQQKKGRGIWQR